MAVSPAAPFVLMASAAPVALVADMPVEAGGWVFAVVSGITNLFAGLFIWLKDRDSKKFDVKLALTTAEIARVNEAAKAAEARAAATEARASAAEARALAANARAEDVAKKAHDLRGKLQRMQARQEMKLMERVGEVKDKVEEVEGQVVVNTEKIKDHSAMHRALGTEQRTHNEPDHPNRRRTDVADDAPLTPPTLPVVRALPPPPPSPPPERPL